MRLTYFIAILSALASITTAITGDFVQSNYLTCNATFFMAWACYEKLRVKK